MMTLRAIGAAGASGCVAGPTVVRSVDFPVANYLTCEIVFMLPGEEGSRGRQVRKGAGSGLVPERTMTRAEQAA